MKKSDMLTFHIDFDDVVTLRLHLYFGNDVESCIKFADKHGHKLTNDHFGGKAGLFVHTENTNNSPIVFCGQIPRDTFWHSVVLHELYHFVDWVCVYHNIPLVKGSEEFRALLYGRTAEQYFEKVLRLRNPK